MVEHACIYISAREGWYCPVCDPYMEHPWAPATAEKLEECRAHIAAPPPPTVPPPAPAVPPPEETTSVKRSIHPYMKLTFKKLEPLLEPKTSTRDAPVDATNLLGAKLRVYGKLGTNEVPWFVTITYGGFSYKINDQDVFVATDFPSEFEKTVDVTGLVHDGTNEFQGVLWVEGVVADKPIWVEFGSELTLTYPKGLVPAEPVGAPEQPKEEEEEGWEELLPTIIGWAPWIIGGFLVVMALGYLAPLIPRPPPPERRE